MDAYGMQKGEDVEDSENDDEDEDESKKNDNTIYDSCPSLQYELDWDTLGWIMIMIGERKTSF
jgi:hypothetical protein